MALTVGSGIGVFVVVFLIAAIATPVGIGGGLLFTPLLQISLGFAQNQAVALSQVLVSGASLGSLLYQIAWQYRHANSLLLVQGQWVYILLPSITAGSVLGVFLSRVLPMFVQPLTLAAICAFSTWNILSKGIVLYRKESADRRAKRSLETGVPPTVVGLSREKLSDDSPMSQVTTPLPLMSRATKLLCLFVVGVFLLNLFLTLIKGSEVHSSFSGIEYCGTSYWIVYGFQFLVFFGLSLFLSLNHWKLSLFITAAGAIATFTGIGGGIVMGPVLLGRGLSPQQSSATSMIMVTCMSLSAAIDFLYSGLVPAWQSAFALVTFAASGLGMSLIAGIVKKTGRSSLIVLILGGLVAFGGAATLGVGINNAITNYKKGIDPFSFQSLCPSYSIV